MADAKRKVIAVSFPATSYVMIHGSVRAHISTTTAWAQQAKVELEVTNGAVRISWNERGPKGPERRECVAYGPFTAFYEPTPL